MHTPELILSLALDGDDVACINQAGLKRHLVIQQALHLAEDPAIALAHPELVQRVRDRAEAQRVKRSPAPLRNKGRV